MLKRKQIAIVLIVMLLLVATGCTQKTEEEESVVRTSFMMGTIITIKVFGPHRVAAADAVVEKFKQLEQLMSVNIETSEVSQINANAGKQPVKVSEDTFAVLKMAIEYAERTDGLFDPSIGPLVDLWGIGTGHAKVPTQAEIEKILPLINYKNIELNEAEQTIYLTQPGMKIDVGGIAKGYAADKAIEIYRENSVKSAFVNLGGNVMVHGAKPDKSLWRIGIQHPRQVRDELMATIDMQDSTVVTSGDYERFFEKNGVRYHHILNPKTGYPSTAGLISASIIGERSADADALSTSVFLLGAEEGKKLAEERGFQVMLVGADKKIYMSEGLRGKMEFLTEEYSE